MNRRSFTVLALVLTALPLAGCGGEAATATAPSRPGTVTTGLTVPRVPVYTVYGADRTGSYEDMTRLALGIAATLIDRAGPGDELVMRWISDRSYQTDQVFAHLRMPVLPEFGPVNRRAPPAPGRG